jgi:hypothetical protein
LGHLSGRATAIEFSDDGKIFAIFNANKVMKFNENGEKLWERKIEGLKASNIGWGNKFQFLTNGFLLACLSSDIGGYFILFDDLGDIVWTRLLPRLSYNFKIFENGEFTLVLGIENLYLINNKDGSLRYLFSKNGEFFGSFSINNFSKGYKIIIRNDPASPNDLKKYCYMVTLKNNMINNVEKFYFDELGNPLRVLSDGSIVSILSGKKIKITKGGEK